MKPDPYASELSRRAFLAGSAGLWISANLPRPVAAAEAAKDATPRTLTRDEWNAVDAIAARIIPSDETPGAREAGCVNFIDKALGAEDADALPLYRAALRALDAMCVKRRKKPFTELEARLQDEVLAALETEAIDDWQAEDAAPDAFFASVRLHTILGFVSDPRHGGNRDYIGWRTMGYPGSVHHLGGANAAQVRGDERFTPVWERAPHNRAKPHG